MRVTPRRHSSPLRRGADSSTHTCGDTPSSDVPRVPRSTRAELSASYLVASTNLTVHSATRRSITSRTPVADAGVREAHQQWSLGGTVTTVSGTRAVRPSREREPLSSTESGGPRLLPLLVGARNPNWRVANAGVPSFGGCKPHHHGRNAQRASATDGPQSLARGPRY